MRSYLLFSCCADDNYSKMLLSRNRRLAQILVIVSFLALSYMIIVHMKQGGCMQGTGEGCAREVIQAQDDNGVIVGGESGSAASFLPGETKAVIILAYQRTGSSLFGRMFNSNLDNVFYLFEPLDAIYSAMYGTVMGWNVPSDITNYANGSIRTVPERELAGVSESLRSMFSCDVDRLPTQLLFSSFLRGFPDDFSTLGQYTACLDRFNLTDEKCKSPKSEIEKFCGGRFGQVSKEDLSKCYQFMWNGNFDVKNVSDKVRQSFSEYRSCMKGLREETDRNCSALFREACTRRPVRVVKSVRATMESMEPLLRRLPNFRVIHLIRDPRGVIVSRKNFHESVRGRYSDGASDQLVREAQLYCQSVVQDIRTRQRLEKSFPGRIYSVVYDNFVRNMVGYVKDIYRFLEMEMPNSTSNWVNGAIVVGNGRNATDVASAWQDVVSFRTNELVIERCREFFSLVGTKLPM